MSQRSNVQASALNIDSQAWLDKFFTVEDGDVGRVEADALFEESRIGYLPEGFEKVSENILFSLVEYKYQNAKEEYVFVRVYRDKMISNVDNEDAIKGVYLNAAGYEYTLINRTDGNKIAVMWKDENEIYYYLIGTLDEEEIIKIMDGISY